MTGCSFVLSAASNNSNPFTEVIFLFSLELGE